jgi:hypothetical protein
MGLNICNDKFVSAINGHQCQYGMRDSNEPIWKNLYFNEVHSAAYLLIY